VPQPFPGCSYIVLFTQRSLRQRWAEGRNRFAVLTLLVGVLLCSGIESFPT